MLHCNNVSWVFPFSSVRACGVISDWHLILVCDWLVSSLLAWFLASSFGGAPFLSLRISFPLRFLWRFDLCAS